MTMQPQPIAEFDPSVKSLVDFRSGLYRCLTGWADATFELVDAVLGTPGPVSSVPALSLEPVFRRSHGSLYKALARGGVDAEAVREPAGRTPTP